ncbi:glycosyltransferase family 4 protein [Streptomyces sp. NPDC001068]|uniref:glycosyltransferase family 4 protein n=1 Tax=Streptomyces sp. NPDC001068 TaxID=3364544 RepID=UPI00368EF927
MQRQQTGLDREGSGPERLLHIGLVHWSFPPCVGGVETHLWEYSRALAARGHRVTVFSGTRDPQQPCDGVEMRAHRLLDLSVPRRDDERDVRELADWFRPHLTRAADPVRLVHGHNLHHFSSVPARALKSLREELGLVLPHTYHSIWRRPQDEELARECAVWDVHHAVSDFLVSECAAVLGEKVDRTYLGVDTKSYLSVPEVGETGPRPVILLPARLIPNKGATVAIGMLRKIIDLGGKRADGGPRLRPRLVLTDPASTVDFHHEKGAFRDELERLVDAGGFRRGAEPDVEFRQAGVDDMRKLYEEAAVVVYPSRFDEPMGLAPLEAMCAARPVVATGVGGLGEGGSTLVEPREGETEDELAARFAAVVWPLLTEPDLARRAGQAAREHVRIRFDLERAYVEPMLLEYGRLLGPAPQSVSYRQPDGSSEIRQPAVSMTSTVSG